MGFQTVLTITKPEHHTYRYCVFVCWCLYCDFVSLKMYFYHCIVKQNFTYINAYLRATDMTRCYPYHCQLCSKYGYNEE